MPTPTYEPLANVTLASETLSVSFSSINQGYRDLVVVCTGKTPFNNTVFATFNGDTAALYSNVSMRGTGSSSATGSNVSQTKLDVTFDTFDANTIGNFIMNIMDYSATDKHKPVLSRSNNAGLVTVASAGRWNSTSAISTITFTFANGSSGFSSGTTFALYGIAS